MEGAGIVTIAVLLFAAVGAYMYLTRNWHGGGRE